MAPHAGGNCCGGGGGEPSLKGDTTVQQGFYIAPSAKESAFPWKAVFVILVVLPVILGMGFAAGDFLYPATTKPVPEMTARAKVESCFTSANPSKLSGLDALMEKHKDKEDALLNQLSKKYSDIKECQF